MKTVRLVFWCLVALCLIVVGIANRDIVALHALPNGLSGPLGLGDLAINLPLFVVLFIGVAFGLVVGFLWEWIREAPVRAAMRRHRDEVSRLGGEVTRLRREKSVGQGDAEILALLEASSKAK